MSLCFVLRFSKLILRSIFTSRKQCFYINYIWATYVPHPTSYNSFSVSQHLNFILNGCAASPRGFPHGVDVWSALVGSNQKVQQFITFFNRNGYKFWLRVCTRSGWISYSITHFCPCKNVQLLDGFVILFKPNFFPQLALDALKLWFWLFFFDNPISFRSRFLGFILPCPWHLSRASTSLC